MRFFRLPILILLLSFLPFILVFSNPALNITHDGFAHIPRIAAYYKALTGGEFPIRWVADLNYKYGMPLFDFIYQLPYFIASIFIFFGAGLVASFKLTLFLSYLMSGAFMFLFAREFFKDEKKAILASIIYQFTPFHLIELITRGAFGEVYVYAFFPLVLFGLCRLWKKQNYLNFFLTTIAAALLILSHNSLSLVFFGVAILFVLFFSPSKKKMLYSFSALFSSLLISAFYWLPALWDHKYTYGDLFMRSRYLLYFQPLQNFFIPNFLNSKSLQVQGISVWLGFFQSIVLVVSLFLFVKKSAENKKLLGFVFLLIALSFYFMLPISNFFWQHFSLLRQFQFPWRFMPVVCFALSLLSAYFLSFKIFGRKYIFELLILLIILSSIAFWKPLGFFKINEQYYWNFPLTTTYFGETDLIWSKSPASSYPKNPVDVIDGKAVVSNFVRNAIQHTFFVNVTKNAVLVEHTQYFPGWRVYIDGKEVPVQFQDPNWRGQITFPVGIGKHNVLVVFGETLPRVFSDIVSASFIILLLGTYFFRKKFFS